MAMMTDHESRASIAQQAAEWYVRNRDEVVSAQTHAAFGTWLKASPWHIEEYLKTAVMSRDLYAATGTLEADIDALLAEARAQDAGNVVSLRGLEAAPDPKSRFRRLIRPRKIALIAAAALLAVAGATWVERDGQRFGLSREFSTVHGEQRSWLLPDGTGLSLNSDSALIVRYNGRERLVQIERGQALFQVVHENGRRFRVAAGDAGVIAVGTEFDVFRKSASTVITVVEGKVAVFTGNAPPAIARAALPSQAVSVSAGEQIQVNDDARPAKPSRVNVQRAVAWVEHQIAFDQRPLGEVAEEFTRYSAVPIVIQNSRLRNLPISGVFNAYDTDSFVAFIARLGGVEIRRSADRILVLDDPNGSSTPPTSD
jgi:transmembrane sensor